MQVLLDVAGYTPAGRPTSAGTLWAPQPSRIADSRTGYLQGRGPVPALGTVGVPVVASGSLVAAAAVTVTVVSPAAAGHVTVWWSGAPMPGTSNVNFQAGQNVATTVIVRVGPDGVNRAVQDAGEVLDRPRPQRWPRLSLPRARATPPTTLAESLDPPESVGEADRRTTDLS